MPDVNINYLAVLVSSIISMLLGALWYGPLFGKAWMKENGFSEDELKKNFNPLKTFGLTFLAQFVIAAVIAYFISLTGASSLIEGIRVSAAAFVGFSFMILLINAVFTRKTTKLIFIDAGYYGSMMLIMGIIIILWK